MPTRLAVLGSPIAHSRSPRIHAAAYRVLRLDWRYTAVRCGEPGLAAFIAGRGPEWRGFSVTMPLKVEAHRIAAALDPVAVESGVANTLLRLDGGGWFGANTDVAGLAAAVRDAALDARVTVVLGSGATAVSAILAARDLGAERVYILARNVAAAARLVDRFSGTTAAHASAPMRVEYLGAASEGWDAVERPTLVISTLPGPAAATTTLPESITATPLFDAAYDPWPSPLAARWRAAGGLAVPGTDMLVAQALVQVRVFTSGDPGLPLVKEEAVLEAMRAAV